MAYLNEFPQWDGNGRNLDWLLEQYSTFNARIQQILDEFNSAVSQMQSDIADLESDYARQLDNFESRIENAIEQFENNINEEVDSIRDVIEIINENTEQYINENIQSFLWNVVTVTLEKSANVSAESNDTIHFDSYTIPEGYSSFIILEYSEQYQNVIWVGGNINTINSVGIYPSLYYSKSGDNYNFTMNVYNPNTSGALDITARIKILLIPDTTTI